MQKGVFAYQNKSFPFAIPPLPYDRASCLYFAISAAIILGLEKEEIQNRITDALSIHPRRKEMHFGGFTIIDAMSNAEYFTAGAIPLPIPNIINLEDFIAAGVKERWTYYSCVPQNIYSCRFIHMPSARNRIFGTLLYKYQVRGFLHWGFNFYYASLSRYLIDPYRCNNSSYIYPPGDAFLVYPGKNGIPEDSIRHEVFYEGLQDQRVLEKLESLIGREKIQKELDRCSPGGKMKMDQYPKGEEAVLALRARINHLLRNALKKPATT